MAPAFTAVAAIVAVATMLAVAMAVVAAAMAVVAAVMVVVVAVTGDESSGDDSMPDFANWPG